jgi:hypothetical protein
MNESKPRRTQVPVKLKLKQKPGESESEMLERGAAEAAALVVSITAGPTPWMESESAIKNGWRKRWYCLWGPLRLNVFPFKSPNLWKYCVSGGPNGAVFPPKTVRYPEREKAQAHALIVAATILGLKVPGVVPEVPLSHEVQIPFLSKPAGA